MNIFFKQFKTYWKKTFRNIKSNASAILAVVGLHFSLLFAQGVAIMTQSGGDLSPFLQFIFVTMGSSWLSFIMLMSAVLITVYAIMSLGVAIREKFKARKSKKAEIKE